jgi:FMN-dependent NADH-azoreductase
VFLSANIHKYNFILLINLFIRGVPTMANLLFIKANNRPATAAISVQLYETFLQTYRETHPEDQITEVDLFNENLPYLGNDLLTALFKTGNNEAITAKEAELIAIADKHIEQFLAADKIVLAFPLWNFTYPAVLHTYFDYINRAGKTFRYTDKGAVGLAGDKKAMLLNARGGVYTGERSHLEMAVRLAKTNLNHLGITDISTVIIEGHNQYPDRQHEIIQEGLAKAVQAAKTF